MLKLKQRFSNFTNWAMEEKLLQKIVKSRICIGFLGEKNQYNWWNSEFLSKNSTLFLNPIYGRTSLLAQYQGVKEAARIEHDSKIGIGANVFHLYRLPEFYEIKMHNLLFNQEITEEVYNLLGNQSNVESFLKEFSEDATINSVGPVRMGNLSDMTNESNWKKLINHYRIAFHSGTKSFPFFKEEM